MGHNTKIIGDVVGARIQRSKQTTNIHSISKTKMISIIYCTSRENPCFEWFVDSLFLQTTDDERANSIELVFVDYVLSIVGKTDSRRAELNAIIGGRFQFTHVAPKPNLYQCEQRKTTNEYFSPANARNTGAIMARGEYLVFCDDVSILDPPWMTAVRESCARGLIVCGAYQKHFEVNVIGGVLMHSRQNPGGIDSRWNMADERAPIRITGQQMYGCSFAIPRHIFFQVNGMDEICDSIGGEDYHFGLRLNYAGHQINYWRKMYTIESEEMHGQPYLMRRDDRVLTPDAYMAKLATFGVHSRFRMGNWDSSHIVLDILHGLRSTQSLYNKHSLVDITPGQFPDVGNEITTHWFDGKPLIEM